MCERETEPLLHKTNRREGGEEAATELLLQAPARNKIALHRRREACTSTQSHQSLADVADTHFLKQHLCRTLT